MLSTTVNIPLNSKLRLFPLCLFQVKNISCMYGVHKEVSALCCLSICLWTDWFSGIVTKMTMTEVWRLVFHRSWRRRQGGELCDDNCWWFLTPLSVSLTTPALSLLLVTFTIPGDHPSSLFFTPSSTPFLDSLIIHSFRLKFKPCCPALPPFTYWFIDWQLTLLCFNGWLRLVCCSLWIGWYCVTQK